MKKYLSLSVALALAGCGSSEDSRVIQLPAGGQTAMTINGTAVPQSLLEAVARQHNWHLDQPPQRGQALRVLTDMVLINEEARKANYFADPQFQVEVEAARLRGVADAAATEFEKRSAITDAVLKAEYDAQIAHTGKSAYDFTQLLFDTEDQAIKAEADVLAGKPFQQVYDAWRAKAKQGRAFTRVRLDQVPEELGKVISGMQNGETTKVPVKTQFGWHVVHLDIVNPYSPPEFDQVKDGIRRNLQMKVNRERLDKIREQAKIEYAPGVVPPPIPAGAGGPAGQAGRAGRNGGAPADQAAPQTPPMLAPGTAPSAAPSATPPPDKKG